VVEGNSDVLYKCCLIGAKKELKLALQKRSGPLYLSFSFSTLSPRDFGHFGQFYKPSATFISLRPLPYVGITAAVARLDGYTHRQYFTGALYGCTSRAFPTGVLYGCSHRVFSSALLFRHSTRNYYTHSFVYIYGASCPSSRSLSSNTIYPMLRIQSLIYL
jgi:hypothetical protein